MVLQYADTGNLHKLMKYFQILTWRKKLKILEDISRDLNKIHKAGYIHANLPGGNILQDGGLSYDMHTYISDLGLSEKADENDLENNIYGVMPYIAPEVLSGQGFTNAADIYGFGIIMAEMSTGERPFDGYDFDISLAVKICNGLRPEFAQGTPDCYVKLAKQCMNHDPNERPTTSDILKKIEMWNIIIADSHCQEDLDKYHEYYEEGKSEIKNQFLEADKIIKKMPVAVQKHLDHMYTSKLINTKKIVEALKF